MWLLAVILFCWEVNSVRITKHAPPETAFAGKDQKSTTLVMAISRQEAWDEQEETDFVEQLKTRLPLDQCYLLENDSTETKIMLIVRCLEKKPSSAGVKAHSSPAMPHTMDDYLLKKFGVANVLVEKQRVYKKPISYWYGTPENLRTLMRLHYDELPPLERQQLANTYTMRQTHAAAESVQLNAPWNLARISMRFGILDSNYYYLNDGTDVDIYIVDTGIRTTHVEFGGRASFLINTVGDGQDTDLNGHGTHVAGIAGAATWGVAKNASLIAVKVLDAQGDGSTSSINLGLMAVEENAQQSGRRGVINLSFGGEQSTILDQAVLSLVQANLAVTVAAGNEADNACNYSPSDLGGALGVNTDGVLSVGASDITDTRASFSNYGRCVSLTAPGVDITSTWYTSDTAVQTLSGTSMSSPHAAGVGALVLSQNLSLAATDVTRLLQLWNTPAVIGQTTLSGGGQNLLYSLIVDNQTVTVIVPTQQPPPPPVSTPFWHNSQPHSSPLLCTLIFYLVLYICLM